MRFYPYPKFAIDPTPCRVAAANRAVARERDQISLFPDLAQYQTVQDRLDEQDQDRKEFRARMRAWRLESWRRARKKYFSLPIEDRKVVWHIWQSGLYPGTPEYLLELLRDTGSWPRLIQAITGQPLASTIA